MNKRLISVLLFAVLVSGAATILIYRMLAAKITSAAAPETRQLVVAARDLPVGTLITPADIKSIGWSGAIPRGSAGTPDEALNRGVLTTIYEGEPVLQTRLAPKGAGGGMAATIPVGKRAVAVKVNDVVGVAGFVVPGMRVDVIISGTPPNAGNTVGTLTKTVLQNIEVLSAGQKIDKTAEGKPESVGVVNLLVTPEQAEILSLASHQTQIQLVLRNPLDTQETKTPGTATASLFSGMPYQAPAPARVAGPRRAAPAAKPKVEEKIVPVPYIVEILHGAKRAQTPFEQAAGEKN